MSTKGKSTNTGGGTEISFTNTPQARDDLLGTLASGILDYNGSLYFLNVMANDLGGNAKSLWSVDDGVNQSGAMSGHEAGDLLTQDLPEATSLPANVSRFGARLSITADGRIAYDSSTISGQAAADLTALALGETLTDSFIYAIRLSNGTLSWAKANVVLTGVNDKPVVQAVAIGAVEDGGAVTGAFNGDDVDSDDDGASLVYTLVSAPTTGSITNNGNGTFTYDPGSNFQSLAVGETTTVNFDYTATDRHGAVSKAATVTVTVTGVNDDPTLAAGLLAATEDGSAVTLDLATLGDDIDSDDDGSTLTYSVAGLSAGQGSASVSGTTLTFAPGVDFQTLAVGETTTVELQVTATDAFSATATNTVTVTVTGTNDVPTLAAGVLAASEDGGAVTLDLAPLGDDTDSDDDGSTLLYSLGDTPSKGSGDVNGTTLTYDPGQAFQYLGANESASVDLNVLAEDGNGGMAVNKVTVTVAGANDAPEITGGTASGAVTQSANLAAYKVEQWTGYQSNSLASLQAWAASNAPNYTAYTSVVDFTDDPLGFPGELPFDMPWPAATATGASGTGGINNVFFARVSAQIQITTADTYTFRTWNDDGVFVRVGDQLIISDTGYHPEARFEGSLNLQPGVYPVEIYFYENGGEASLEFSYRAASGSGTFVSPTVPDLYSSGNLNFSDVDLSDSHTVSVSAIGSTAGSLTANITTDTTGSGTGGVVKWDYTVTNAAVKHLGAGDTKVESFMVTVADGKGGTDQQQVDITITGINDVAVLGDAEMSLTETDATLTTGGTLSITDADDDEAQFTAQSNVAGAYGKFNIDANGAWTYVTNGALDQLTEGQVVTDSFAVTSVDGTATAVSVSITGSADGPTAVADTNTLSASSPAQNTGNTVYWVDWQSINPVPGSAFGEVTIEGTITLPDRTIGVTYTGQIYSQQTFIAASNQTNYWQSSNGSQWFQGGYGVYTSGAIANGPGNTNFDFIALALANTPRNVTFSEPVANLFFAVASMNGNGYLFDQPFTVVSSADSANDRGYWGHASSYTLSQNNGQYGIATASSGFNEFHGVLAINNAVDSLTWVSQSVEYWQGFTVGTYGVAQSATVAGSVLTNDIADSSAPSLEVSAAGGQTMVGNSVTLNLASGAILRVDRDGGYLYNDNGKFAHLKAGDSHVETVSYTVRDNQGATDTATLTITVNGLNDAPKAVADAFSVNEDATLTLNASQLLSNDTDIDAGDSKALVSVQNAVNGVVALNNGVVTFTPNANFFGNAGFSYTMRDAAGLTSTASVGVTVNSVADTFVLANLVSNGSFENGLTGWSNFEINYIGDWQAADGSKLLDLNAERGGGYVDQLLQTTPGTTYTVGFALSKNPGSPTGAETLRVSAAGSSQTYDFTQSNTTSNMLWQEHKFSFVATHNVTALRLASADPTGGTDAWGPALDEVVAFENRTIAFDKSLGDVLDLSGVLDSIGAPDPNLVPPGFLFLGGFVQFQIAGSNTVVSVDADGGGDNFIAIATLVGVNLLESDTANYIL